MSESQPSAENQHVSAPSSRLAGGVAVITGAKIWFVLAGYALYFGLTRLLGPELFGLYAVAISVVSVINNVLIAASLQTVSRFVARDADRSGAVLRQAWRIQVVVGLGLFILLQIAAPLIATWFRDSALTIPIRISAGIVFAYALYAANVGFLNGNRLFTRQAGLDATFSTIKTGFILSAVALGLGVAGAVSGFVLAAFTILGLSFIVVRAQPRPDGHFAAREYLSFGGWLVLLTIVANLVLTADLWVVKRLADPEIANLQSGLYRAALTLSQLLYQLLIPLTLVVFPNLARLGVEVDRSEARRLLRGAMRYLAIAVIPSAAVLAAVGDDVVALLYGEAYREGGQWLTLLAPAYALWTAAYLLATALCGAGRPRPGVAVLTLALLGQVTGGVLLYPLWGPRGAAAGDLLGMGLGLVAGLFITWRSFGSIIEMGGLVRGILLAAVLGAAAYFWPASGLYLLIKLAVLGVAGLGILFVSGDLPRLPFWGARGDGESGS
jgi:O-antigen/teichoic acid export membrane protein